MNKKRCDCLLAIWCILEAVFPNEPGGETIKKARQKKPMSKRVKIAIAILVAVAFAALLSLLFIIMWSKGYI